MNDPRVYIYIYRRPHIIQIASNFLIPAYYLYYNTIKKVDNIYPKTTTQIRDFFKEDLYYFNQKSTRLRYVFEGFHLSFRADFHDVSSQGPGQSTKSSTQRIMSTPVCVSVNIFKRKINTDTLKLPRLRWDCWCRWGFVIRLTQS